MEYLKCNGNLKARLKIENKQAEIHVTGNPPPVRAYGIGDGEPVYMGLLEPRERGCFLSAKAENFKKIILTEGVLGEAHENLFEFGLTDGKWQRFPEVPRKPTAGEEYLFSHPDTKKCVDFFGYYLAKDEGDCITYAFPSDFYTHPLPHLMPYAYWYKLDLGLGEQGYFVLSRRKDEWQFADVNLLTKK